MAASSDGLPAVGVRDGVPWTDVVLGSIAAVSWAMAGMAATAALGLHLLGADSAGALGPMTAAVTVLAVGGSVTPSGDVSVFGLEGAEATTAVDITPLGVSLVGAVLLAHFFLRSLRGAGAYVRGRELAARAAVLTGLFLGVVGWLAWAGHDVITFDGDAPGIGELPGNGADEGEGGIEVPGLGEIGDSGEIGDIGGIGDIAGLLPDRLGDLERAQASVGFSVDTADSLAGALFWVLGVLLVALLASRRTPLPSGWDAVHRLVRPAVSALVTVLLVAVAAGAAAAAYAAAGDEHPGRIGGAALLGTPNGVWLAVPLGLFVPWDGGATGGLAELLPDPLDELSRISADGPITVGALAELDGRVWLLAVACALTMLCAGVLTAVRTPRAAGARTVAFAARCAVALGMTTAVALPLLVGLTRVSADASLSVLGVDAFGAGIELHGRPGAAVALGAAWGAGAGAAGALLACVCGAAGRRVSPLASRSTASRPGPGPYRASVPYRPPNADTNPYLRLPPTVRPRTEGPRDGPPQDTPPDEPPPPGAPGARR
ncbi:streptophobe family protein [Streptomyces sp. NPDC091376]|uniref:streptophobe family protein n=1 Tax=Streptomyces sp. NPDC091376 TaxID=3365994 RepID=UPI00380F17AF